MELFLSPFEGFESADFEAYTEEKWSSNLYNKSRMKVRDKLNALGHHVHRTLTEAGHVLSFELNDFRPNVFNGRQVDAQWLFFTRPEEDKKKLFAVLDREKSIAENFNDPAHHKRHVILGVRVHEMGLDIMLALHRNAGVDVRNTITRLEGEWERERLAIVLQELANTAAQAMTLDLKGDANVSMAAFYARLQALVDGKADWLMLGEQFGANDARIGSDMFKHQLAERCAALMPLYHFMAWSSENDHITLRETLKTEREQHKKAEAGQIEPGSEVLITAGLFSGKRGVVQEIDRKGMVKVSLGKMVVQVKGKAIKLLG
ncbi:MAG: KOW motif-containing protein [Myxococcota bacterium]